jgi:predicted thioredoxin/glutaredoxin
MSINIIELFVMDNCQICPQMERLFERMHQNGAFNELKIVNIGNHPEVDEKNNIRSVPYYLINDIGFSGLKTQHEIMTLLQQGEVDRWQEFLKSELSEGVLKEAEVAIIENSSAREAMMLLLDDINTTLVVRIGLSAIIETVAESGLLNDYENHFISLASQQDERIAIDAIYYLSLLATKSSLHKLREIAENGAEQLKSHAEEVLQDLEN